MKKIKNYLLLSFFVSLIGYSCNTQHTSKNTMSDTISIQNGKVYSHITCSKDATVNYSIYIPKSYEQGKNIPVIFAFDPHANGMLPVDLLKDDAEKFGYMVVGSNNSKNGLAWESNKAMIDVLFDDIFAKYSIDKRRVYTIGFSGGSRVASLVALLKGGINGVIGCGAGFPNFNQPIENKFSYLGFVGNADFNLFEMNKLDKELSTMGFTHYIEVFNGKHEWIHKTMVADVFVWMEFNAIKDNLIAKKDTLLVNTLLNYQKKLEYYNKTNDTYYEYQMYKKIICFFDKLTDISDYEKKLKEMESSPALKKILLKKEQIEKREMELQQSYSEAMQTKDLAWWKKEMIKLTKQVNDSSNIEEALLMKRTMSYLSLVAYMNSSGALNAKKLEEASKYIAIYALVDPTNVDQCYFEACLNSLQGNTDKAFEALEKAIKLGFSDKEKMVNDNMLNNIKGLAKFQEILGKLKN